MLKFVIGDNAAGRQRDPASCGRCVDFDDAGGAGALPKRTFELQRGSGGGEIQWLINGPPFDAGNQLAFPRQGEARGLDDQQRRRRMGPSVAPPHGGAPRRLAQRQADVDAPKRGSAAPRRHWRGDVIALGPSESVVVYRRFRTFAGPYVAHCHNLAHEDHAMMFGWEIVP